MTRPDPEPPSVVDRCFSFMLVAVLAVMLFPARALAYFYGGSTKLPSASGCVAIILGCVVYGMIGLVIALAVLLASR